MINSGRSVVSSSSYSRGNWLIENDSEFHWWHRSRTTGISIAGLEPDTPWPIESSHWSPLEQRFGNHGPSTVWSADIFLQRFHVCTLRLLFNRRHGRPSITYVTFRVFALCVVHPSRPIENPSVSIEHPFERKICNERKKRDFSSSINKFIGRETKMIHRNANRVLLVRDPTKMCHYTDKPTFEWREEEEEEKRGEGRNDVQWDSHHVSHFTFLANSLNIVCRCSLSWNRVCLCICFVVMTNLSRTLWYRSVLTYRCFSYKGVYLFSLTDKQKKRDDGKELLLSA